MLQCTHESGSCFVRTLSVLHFFPPISPNLQRLGNLITNTLPPPPPSSAYCSLLRRFSNLDIDFEKWTAKGDFWRIHNSCNNLLSERALTFHILLIWKMFTPLEVCVSPGVNYGKCIEVCYRNVNYQEVIRVIVCAGKLTHMRM